MYFACRSFSKFLLDINYNEDIANATCKIKTHKASKGLTQFASSHERVVDSSYFSLSKY